MIRVTLDTNIIIKATKSDEVDHDLALKLIKFHKQNLITLQIVAANASEYKRSMQGEYRSLQGDLASLGFSQDSLRILPIVGNIGMAYLDHFYIPSEEIVYLINNVWSIVFAPAPIDHQKFCEYYKVSLGAESNDYLHRRWQNYMCDVLTIVEYIQDCQQHTADNDICLFVTTDDDDILSHVDELKKLGAKPILCLEDALNEIESLVASEDV